MTEIYLNKLFNETSPLVFNWWDKYHHAILIVLLGTLILLFALTLKKNSYTIRYINYIASVSILMLLILSPFNNINLVSNLWYNDDPLYLSFYMIGGLFIVLILINISELSFIKDNKEIEFPMLILMGFLASVFLIGTTNLMGAFIALECLAFLSYVLVAFERQNRLSSQSGVRYLFLGAVPTGLFVLGAVELYSFLGTFNLEDISKLFFGTNEINTLHTTIINNLENTNNFNFLSIPDYNNYINLVDNLYNINQYSVQTFNSLETTAINLYTTLNDQIINNNDQKLDFIANYLSNNNNIELPVHNYNIIETIGELVNSTNNIYNFNNYNDGSAWLIYNLKFTNTQKWLDYNTWDLMIKSLGNSDINSTLLKLSEINSNNLVLNLELQEYSRIINNTDTLTGTANEILSSNFNLSNSLKFYIYYLVEAISQFKIFELPIILKISIILIAISLLFKVTAAPFNMWAPRVYEGAPLSSAMFLTIFSKIAVIFFMLRFFLVYFYDFVTSWAPIFLLCGLLSMLAAIIGAISETKIKRFFVYSSMSHVGLMLLALSCANIHGGKAIILYLIVYTITSLGGWTIITLLMNRVNKIHSKKLTYITSLKGLSKNNAVLSFFFAIIMFSMGGIPPLAGFFAKFEVLYALSETQLFSIAFAALLLSVISFFYYLRIVKVLYFDPDKKYRLQNKQSQEKAFILSIGFLVTIFFILYAQQPLIYCIRSIFKSFFQEIFIL